MRFWERRAVLPIVIALGFAAIYAATAAGRLARPTENNHYVHLANAWLRGRLDVGSTAPGTNDWACFDVVERVPCPRGGDSFGEAGAGRYRWYVSFPPLPAVLILPVVAVFGLSTLDALFWVLVAGLAPGFLFSVLRLVRESGRSGRTVREDLLVTSLFGVGSVYYFVAVQGTVWFAAHVVASVFVCLYLLFGFDARRPFAAGAALGLAFLCRPATLLLSPFFALQAFGTPNREARASLRVLVRFALPVTGAVVLAMLHNVARFDDPFEFGHRLLQIRWRSRIETWGLFSTHYLSRNLTVFFLSLPWWVSQSPFLHVSRHGLALWLTTPNLFWALVPKRFDTDVAALWVAILPTAACTLLYQNTGWVQFGYRFSLDYLPLLFVLVALSRWRFGRAFWMCAVFAIALNTFGAVTFDRFHQFYADDPTSFDQSD